MALSERERMLLAVAVMWRAKAEGTMFYGTGNGTIAHLIEVTAEQVNIALDEGDIHSTTLALKDLLGWTW